MEDAKKWRPRLVPAEGGHAYFLHPCEICGDPVAPFGFNVSLRSGKPGNWRCKVHKDTTIAAVKSEAKKPEPEKKQMTAPNQGDLF